MRAQITALTLRALRSPGGRGLRALASERGGAEVDVHAASTHQFIVLLDPSDGFFRIAAAAARNLDFGAIGI